MSNDYNIKIGFDSKITTTGIIKTTIVSDENKIRFVVTNATGGNTILVKGRINGQSDWDTITTLSGNVKSVSNISTYDELQVECTVYASASDHVEVIASSFNEAGGSTVIDAPTGGSVDNSEIIFTSSDSSITITAIPSTNTINFVNAGAVSKFAQTFNNTTDWVLNAGNYEHTILFATYGSKANPVIETFETVAGVDTVVYPDIIKNASNNIVLQVSQVPDNRYTGKVIIL